MIGNLFPTDDFLSLANQATERLINGGLWKGTISYAGFPSVDNYFALPYEFLAVVGAQWFRCPVPVFGQFHDFIIGGPGKPLPDLPPEGIVEDLGDGYATAVDPPTVGSTLQIVLDLAIDIGKTFRFYGEGTTRTVYDVFGEGMYVTTTGITTNEGVAFRQVTGIQPPLNDDNSSAMIGGWTLNAVAPDGTVTQLGYYYPNQNSPQFRRYRIGVTEATSQSQVPDAVTVLVRKRWIPVFKETDYIFPGNIGALKFAMQAIDSEASKNPATELWDRALEALNQELHATRGAVRPELTYETLGSSQAFTNLW